MEYKMVPLFDWVSIRVPLGLTPEAEAEYLAKYKEEHLAELMATHDEYKDMLEGKVPLISSEELFKELGWEEKEPEKEFASRFTRNKNS